MAKVTVSGYRELPSDAGSNDLPIASATPTYRDSFGTTAETAALPDETKFIRICSDTAIHVKRDGTGATADDDMLPANAPEFFAASEGTVVSWIPA